MATLTYSVAKIKSAPWLSPMWNSYLKKYQRGHGGAVVTHLPPTSEVSSSKPRTLCEKGAYGWLAVYSTES